VVKIVLDVVMFLILFLMYNSHVAGLNVHEIGGLAVFGLFLIHKGINWRYIVGVGKKFFHKGMPVRAKLDYLMFILLFIAMIFIIVSGVFISRILFPGVANNDSFWKLGHFFASAIAIIIVGIHTGKFSQAIPVRLK
jgi:hypothetical protein